MVASARQHHYHTTCFDAVNALLQLLACGIHAEAPQKQLDTGAQQHGTIRRPLPSMVLSRPNSAPVEIAVGQPLGIYTVNGQSMLMQDAQGANASRRQVTSATCLRDAAA